MKTSKLIGITVATTIAFGAIATSASAGGFFGDIINTVAPGVGTQLDRLNAQAGQPFDHAAAAVADVYVPGSGEAAEAYWAMQRMRQGNGGGFNAASNGGQAAGNFCGVPGAGRFGPGPVQALGAQCFVDTPMGRLFGEVTQ